MPGRGSTVRLGGSLPAPATATARVVPSQVHKRHAEEVYLTHWRRTGDDRFHIRGRRPAAHAFYRVGARFDPLLLCETVRQSFPLLCHAAYGVPPGHQLVWDRFGYRVREDAYGGVDRGPEVELRVECFDISFRGGRPAGLSSRAEVFWGGVPVAATESRFAVLTETVYRRLRGAYADAGAAMSRAVPAAEPVPAARTGRARPQDVVLSPLGDDRWRLRVDTGHDILFDHPVDHVPGMVLLEAAHQAVGGADILRLDCEFRQYVELDAPCTVTAVPEPVPAGESGARRTRISAVQGGQLRFTATVVGRVPPSAEEVGRSAR